MVAVHVFLRAEHDDWWKHLEEASKKKYGTHIHINLVSSVMALKQERFNDGNFIAEAT